jgi:YVTN family beta-propeller protein
MLFANCTNAERPNLKGTDMFSTTRLRKNAGWLAPLALFALLPGCDSEDDAAGTPTSTPITAITYDAVFVLNGAESTISVINTTTQAITGTIGLGGVDYIHHGYLSPDRSTLVVSAPGYDLSMGHGNDGMQHGVHGTVMVMDANTGAMLASCRLPAPNHNVTPSPDGMELWTSQMTMPGSVLVLDAGSLDILAEIPVGDMPAEVTFSTDGRRAFVANTGSNTVTVIDEASHAVLETLPVDGEPVGAWPGANGMMYVDCEHSMTIIAMDALTMARHHAYDLGFTPGMAALAPNGELWVTDADHGQVVFFNADSDDRLGETPTGAGAHAIAFDGTGKAYISNQGAGTVSVVEVSSHTVLQSLAVGTTPNGIVYRRRN